MGPSAVRVAGLNARVASLGYEVEDLGNIPVVQAEATPEGQAGILADYGITEKTMGAPVRPSMETKIIGATTERDHIRRFNNH